MSTHPNQPANPNATPSWVTWTVVVLGSAALFFASWVYKSRWTPIASPRIDLIFGMDNQIKYKPQTENPAFADGRAMRLPVVGTVARGQLRHDDFFFRGKNGEFWAEGLPESIQLNEKLMKRGQERFGVFCAPCHGAAGHGDGMVSQRALELELPTWTPPTNLHEDRIRNMPEGQIFNVITNGARNMPEYGPQIPEEDRWAIVAYLRALQRSQGTGLDDVPADYQAGLK